MRAVRELGYETPSPIQQKAIPPVLAGRDLLGCAQTGTGKTAAFALPILQNLLQTGPDGGVPRKPKGQRPIRVLVLTPTRELALQIAESFAAYGKYLPLRSTVIFGGVGQGPQVDALRRGVDILVATPGRLNDLIGQGYIKLDRLEVFVLDEADRMLDMGFVHDVKRVIKIIPPKRQTLLFSATMPGEIVALANSLLQNPAKVFVTPPATTVEMITQSVYMVEKTGKRHLLAHLLRTAGVSSALVFTRTKHGADRVVRELTRDGIQAVAIHGNKSQGARQEALARLKDGRVKVLVATDIAARGLDINELSHVFNYDLPNIPDTYVHRIGRTGRAGRGGVAISFCCAEERPFLADIQKLIGFAVPVAQGDAMPAPGDALPPKPDVRAEKPAEKANKSAKTDKHAPQTARPALAGERRSAPGAIVTKRPVWSGPPAPAAPPAEREDAMSKNNRRHRARPNDIQAPAATRQPPAAATPPKAPPLPKNEKGIFDFSEKELAGDDSLKLISGPVQKRPDEAKYPNFEAYLKDHEGGSQ